MQVIQYLKEFGIQSLREEFGIKVRETDDLLVLNYDQIESPKTHPIVIECRALILDRDFNIVSRSFDRFFNLGEAPLTQEHLDWSIAGAHEKVDGSLMKVYNHCGYWHIATRGMAYAEGATEFGVTFKQLALKAFGLGSDAEMQAVFNKHLQRDRTYIFELTSMENRVVKHYEGYMMHYLATRVNATGEYGGSAEEVQAQMVGGKYIEKLKFDSAQDCLEASRALKNLDEGYVIYQNGVPVCKVKSPAYLAVHAIRGEGSALGIQSTRLRRGKSPHRQPQEFMARWLRLSGDVSGLISRYLRVRFTVSLPNKGLWCPWGQAVLKIVPLVSSR